nr:hypothetical protein [Tanacetum cinerariifolium]
PPVVSGHHRRRRSPSPKNFSGELSGRNQKHFLSTDLPDPPRHSPPRAAIASKTTTTAAPRCHHHHIYDTNATDPSPTSPLTRRHHRHLTSRNHLSKHQGAALGSWQQQHQARIVAFGVMINSKGAVGLELAPQPQQTPRHHCHRTNNSTPTTIIVITYHPVASTIAATPHRHHLHQHVTTYPPPITPPRSSPPTDHFIPYPPTSTPQQPPPPSRHCYHHDPQGCVGCSHDPKGSAWLYKTNPRNALRVRLVMQERTKVAFGLVGKP